MNVSDTKLMSTNKQMPEMEAMYEIIVSTSDKFFCFVSYEFHHGILSPEGLNQQVTKLNQLKSYRPT